MLIKYGLIKLLITNYKNQCGFLPRMAGLEKKGKIVKFYSHYLSVSD